jgi:peptidoglycan/xylan/chitin deacetylase (PgdA/CDA1 family)
MRPFVVCIHDASPAHAHETRAMIRDLEPLLGRRFSVGVVPDWHGQWPLASHPDYCRLLQESSEELLLHGYFHERRRGLGPVTLLAEGCDEMNGLNLDETRRTLARGQDVFQDVFGRPARGFVAPGWQQGLLRPRNANDFGLEHLLGFFSLESRAGRSVPLATWSWDCGRWGWLGHLGHGIGLLLQSLEGRVPSLALHPRDIDRGFWPTILRVTQQLLDRGYTPTTASGLLEGGC